MACETDKIEEAHKEHENCCGKALSPPAECGPTYVAIEGLREDSPLPPPSATSEVPAVVLDVERLMVQLAGCLCAAEGHIKGTNRATKGMYGWSPAYQAVLELREKHDRLDEEMKDLISEGIVVAEDPPVPLPPGEARPGICFKCRREFKVYLAPGEKMPPECERCQ